MIILSELPVMIASTVLADLYAVVESAEVCVLDGQTMTAWMVGLGWVG